MRHIKEFFAWLFGWVANSVKFALSMNATQIRALMCWGMLLGVAIEGASVLFVLMISRRFDADLIRDVIFYSEIARLSMIAGVIIIAVQANSLKARLGDNFELETALGGTPKVAPKKEAPE